MEQWFSPQSLSALAAMIVSLISATVLFMKDRRSAPIDRRTAEVAVTTAMTAAGKSVVDSALALNDKMTEQAVRLYEEIKTDEIRLSKWEQWYLTLKMDWDEIRKNTSPPEEPDYD